MQGLMEYSHQIISTGHCMSCNASNSIMMHPTFWVKTYILTASMLLIHIDNMVETKTPYCTAGQKNALGKGGSGLGPTGQVHLLLTRTGIWRGRTTKLEEFSSRKAREGNPQASTILLGSTRTHYGEKTRTLSHRSLLICLNGEGGWVPWRMPLHPGIWGSRGTPVGIFWPPKPWKVL